MQLMFTKLSANAKEPTKGTEEAACFDLYASEVCKIAPYGMARVKTDILFLLPEGYEGQIRGRSGISCSGILVQLGTVDSDYRGSCDVIVFNSTPEEYTVKRGMRIAQIAIRPVPDVVLQEVTEPEVHDIQRFITARGSKGFGSTGV